MRSATLLLPLVAFVFALGCGSAPSEQVATDESSSALVSADGTDEDLAALGVTHYKVVQAETSEGVVIVDLVDGRGAVLGTVTIHEGTSNATIRLGSRFAAMQKSGDSIVMSAESAPRAGLALWRAVRDPGLAKRFPGIVAAFPAVHTVSFAH